MSKSDFIIRIVLPNKTKKFLVHANNTIEALAIGDKLVLKPKFKNWESLSAYPKGYKSKSE